MFSQMCAGRKNELWMNLDGTQASFGWNLEKPEECMIGRRGEMTSLLRKDAEIMEEENLGFAGYPAGHTEGFVDAISHGFRQFYGYFGTEDEGRVYADFRAGRRSMLLAEKIYESACKEQWSLYKNDAPASMMCCTGCRTIGDLDPSVLWLPEKHGFSDNQQESCRTAF